MFELKIVDRNKVENSITVIPQDSDDLYILHNIISPLDYISAKTSRRIKRDEGGSGSKERTAVTLKIQVESTEFRGFGDIIRIKGKIIESSDEQISLGTYHSIKIELLKKIKIEKLTKWSSFELEKLEEAQLGFSTGLLAVIIDDESVLVSEVGNHASRIILDLEPTIPRKGSDPVQYEKAIQTMFKDAAKFLHDKSREGISKQIVLGGPGFIYQAFLDYLKFNYPDLAKHTMSFGINNAGRNGIKELLIHHLPDNFVSAKQAREQAILVENVLEELGKNSKLIVYGSMVNQAAEIGAIQKLLVMDTKLHQNPELRKDVEDLINQVKMSGGQIFLISSMQESHEIITGLGGIVAFLRFPLPKT